jgi:alanine racemase
MTHPLVSPASPVATPIPRVFRPRRSAPTDVVRPTRAEISLPNLRFNLRALQRRTQANVWCVLKADAYGHGAKACAHTLERAGANGICVALLEEGIELRNAGIQIPILVMGGYYGRAYSELLAHHLTPVLCDAGQVADFAEEVSYRGAFGVAMHVKVDTGMGRLGARPQEMSAIAQAIRHAPQLELEGLMTHFACAESESAVAEQLELFEQARGVLQRHGVRPRFRHAANTAALLGQPRSHFDIVRPGIGVFGIAPHGGADELRPVMRVLSTIIALRDLAAGQAVGYGATWRASRPSRVATIPIGYADGLSRKGSNQGHVLVAGKRAPIVGAVSMDMTTIDVTEIDPVKIGDEVIILGSTGDGNRGTDRITAGEVAEIQGTIPWEVLTQVSRRVPRFYRGA